MKIAQQGLVLIVVLFMLEVFALLGLYAIKSNSWEMRMAREYWQKQQMLLMAERALSDAEKNVLTARCRIPITSASVLVRQPFAWWHTACTGESVAFEYYYVFEVMGLDACIEVGDGVADYYRLSLLVVPKGDVRAKLLLQSTVATRGVGGECEGNKHIGKLGRQSWRILL